MDMILKDQGDEFSSSRRQPLWSEARLRVGPEEEMTTKMECNKIEKRNRNMCSGVPVHKENKSGWRRTKGRSGHEKHLPVAGLVNKCVQSIVDHKVEQWVRVQQKIKDQSFQKIYQPIHEASLSGGRVEGDGVAQVWIAHEKI